MNSQMFKLNWKDVAKGLATAVLAAVFAYLAQIFNIPGFHFSQIDWAEILRISESAGFAYLVKNFFSNSQGQVFGRIG